MRAFEGALTQTDIETMPIPKILEYGEVIEDILSKERVRMERS